MKREILFRGKRTDNGEWAYGNLIDSDSIVGKIVDFDGEYFIPEFWYKVDPETVGQFTGILAVKAKHGFDMRVFEHDIFRHTIVGDLGDTISYSVVMWIEKYAAFYLIPIDHYEVMRDNDVSSEEEFAWLFDEALLRDFSIDVGLTKVGNIHDNPELIKP